MYRSMFNPTAGPRPATLARPWWSSAVARPTASSWTCPTATAEAYPGDHRGLPGRPGSSVRLPSVPQSLRQYQVAVARILWPAPAHPRLHRAAVSLPVFHLQGGGPGGVRAPQLSGHTVLRDFDALKHTWSGDAWNEWTPSSGATRRPSVSVWSGTWTPCCQLRCPTTPAIGPGEFVVAGTGPATTRCRWPSSWYGYVDQVVISCGTVHTRDDFVYDPIHYLPLLERKPGALDQAARYRDGTSPRSSGRCAVCWKPAWDAASVTYVQVLRLLETFSLEEVHTAQTAGGTAAKAGPGAVSLPAQGQGQHHVRRAIGESGMNDRSTLLLEHHLWNSCAPGIREDGRQCAGGCGSPPVPAQAG